MLKLTVMVKRHPSLSIEEFHERWRAHGRMIAAEADFRAVVRRYEQHHRAIPDYANGDTFDGLALQWYDSMEDFVKFIEAPAYMEKVRPDEQTLLDMSKIVVIFTDDAEVYIP